MMAVSKINSNAENIKYRHSHPINIIEHTTKYLILLILPLLRALFVNNTGFYEWLDGAWFDLVIISVMLMLGFLAWYRYVYYIGESGIHVRQGVVLVKKRFIAYQKLSVIAIECPFYFMPIKAVRVNADTDGGMPTSPDFSVTMRRDRLDEFIRLAKSPFVDYTELKKVYLPKGLYIALLSFVTSNSLTGVIFASTFITGSGKVLGEEFERQLMERINEIARFLAVGLPPFAAMLSIIILGGWLLSFLLNLVRHLRFNATRQGDCLDIHSGLLTRREFLITVKRINMVELRQTFFTKLFGYYVALIHSNGYGKRKDELSVLMPSGVKNEIEWNLKLLLPEISLNPKQIRPKLKYLSRFMIPPVSWILGISAAWYLANRLFPFLNEVILFFGIMVMIPAVWYLLVKIVSYFHTGIGESNYAYTFYYTYGYRIKTVAVPKNKIIKVTLRRSLFQVMSGCCDMVILTFSEGMKRHVVPNLNFEEAKKMFDMDICYENTWFGFSKKKRPNLKTVLAEYKNDDK